MHANGDVDWVALEKLIRWHLDNGTHGIVPMGTTGESATLDTDEHLKVIRRTIEIVAKQVPVIAGTGSNSTREAIHQTQAAGSFGADACLIVTPYYNKPTQEGLFQHYKAISAACDVPVVLYNVPPRTACDMKAETVGRVAGLPGVIGIKEACGDPERIAQIRAVTPDDFIMLSGEDAQTLRMLELGATGTISVTANVLPKMMARFCDAFLAGNTGAAAELDRQLQPIHQILFVETSPAPTKWALLEMGMIERGIRLPLVELSAGNRTELIRRLRAVGALA
jgi:4-hydroxy-tetrahydrodipicolinate synthase